MAQTDKNRNYGIDLLRITAMLMIVTMHILKRGGILDSVEAFSPGYYAAWILETLSYGAVNLYALISGYVCVNGKTRLYRLGAMWLQVEFYCALFLIIFAFIHPEAYSFAYCVNTLFPVSTKYYWYFTAYFIMFFFIPYFNIILNSLSRLQLKWLGGVLLFFSSIWSTVWQSEMIYSKHGYTVVWLSVLYILGGIAKKLELDKKAKSGPLLIGFFAMCAVTAGYKFLAEANGWKAPGANYFFVYDSAPVVIGSICLFLFYAKLKINGRVARKIIETLAPVSFGVYLIHTNGFIWGYIMPKLFTGLSRLPAAELAACVILSAIGVYLVCSAIDWLRLMLFKALRVTPRLKALEDKIRSKISKRESND